MIERDRTGLVFDVAWITIELDSPLTIGGGPALETDVACVTDANGLPTIPGSTIAGVLRHLAAEGDPETDLTCREAFGFQKGDDGEASLIEVSWAQVHGSDDRPVPLRAEHLDLDDPVLAFLAAGITRDHVRLDGHGVVDGNGKFDISSVPAGARFTFEIVVHQGSPLSSARLIELLQGPAARFGGSTRRGLGAFHVVRARGRAFDLTQTADRVAFVKLPRELAQPVPNDLLEDLTIGSAIAPGFVAGTIELRPEDLWLVGGGDPAGIVLADDGGPAPDIVPLTERRISWQSHRASISEPGLLLPASALKGALRHRTAFHARCLRGDWAPAQVPAADVYPAEVEAVFGSLKEHVLGQPGRLFVDDAWPVGTALLPMDHVTIDRFSGGPLDGHLFREAPVSGPQAFVVPITLDLRQGLDATTRGALRKALADLCEGRLALGGGANRGHGYFRGTVTWQDADPLREEAP